MEDLGRVYEEIKVRAADLVEKVKGLIHEGNVRRVIIKDDHGGHFPPAGQELTHGFACTFAREIGRNDKSGIEFEAMFFIGLDISINPLIIFPGQLILY